MNAPKRPSLAKHHKEKRASWSNEYKKIDCSTLILRDKCRIKFVESDGLAII